jgi:hypothetical protein
MLRIRRVGISVLRCFGALRNIALAASLGGIAHADKVKGDLIQFTDNGGWCWYQDERVVVDLKRGGMVISALANKSGVGGSPGRGTTEAQSARPVPRIDAGSQVNFSQTRKQRRCG